MNFSIPDPNLAVETTINEPDIRFYDIRTAPVDVYGLYDYKNQPQFKRIPDDVAKATSEGVSILYTNTAGGRVRFCTDSKYVAIRTEMPTMCLMPHMAFMGSAGFDLYVDDPVTGISRYKGPFKPAIGAKGGFEFEIKFSTATKRYLTLNFPSYSDVKNLYLGLQKDAFLGEGLKYIHDKPIVYYGSSITQGACASHPGNAYQNIVSRHLNMDFINLGFSGNGKGEDAIVNYMATLPMLAFVSDYDHNSPSTEHLKNTHQKLYDAIRKTHPDIPYVIVTRTDPDTPNFNMTMNNLAVAMDTFRYAREKGDKNVYFLDGNEIFRGPYLDQCTVEGCHPTDLGFALMADSFECILRQIFTRSAY